MRVRKDAMDRFRTANVQYLVVVKTRAQALEARAIVLSVLIVVVLGGAFAFGGMVLARQATARRVAARATERDFETRQRE